MFQGGRKLWRNTACLVLSLALLTACAVQGDGAQSGSRATGQPVADASHTAGGSQPAAGAPKEGEKNGLSAVSMMIPSNQQALGELLSRLAKEQNCQLTLRVGANEPRYTLELAEALAGQDAPQLYWLAGEFSGQVLAAAGAAPLDVSATGNVALDTLARMVPTEMRVLGSEGVYGLPVGVFAEGTLVNLEMLAALLGCEDPATLGRDLIDCSYKEWKTMQQAVAAYLQKPSRYQFRLGGGVYTMPNYRPAEAENLRGLWALPTVGEAGYGKNGLSAVYSAAYADPADYLSSDPADLNLFLEEPLQALLAEIEFETLHMTNEAGALARGENFNLAGEVTAEQAKKLFAEGRALLWKGDSRQALALEDEQPALLGKLFMVPTKLPFENQEVALQNNLYSVGVDGYLCLPGPGAASPEAAALLLQLYTAPAWRSQLEDQLGLLPYTSLFPQRSLLAGLEEAVGLGEYYQQPLPQQSLAVTQQKLGEWLNLNLMGKESWEEQDKADFLVAIQGMLGEIATQVEGE